MGKVFQTSEIYYNKKIYQCSNWWRESNKTLYFLPYGKRKKKLYKIKRLKTFWILFGLNLSAEHTAKHIWMIYRLLVFLSCFYVSLGSCNLCVYFVNKDHSIRPTESRACIFFFFCFFFQAYSGISTQTLQLDKHPLHTVQSSCAQDSSSRFDYFSLCP